MTYLVRRHADAGSFLDAAGPWLMAHEAENNLVLGVARSLAQGEDWYEPPLYLATVEVDGRVTGAAFRTPPHKFVLTRMPIEAVPALAEDAAAVYGSLPTVLGPVDVATTFGDVWAVLRGVGTRPGMVQQIYQADSITQPADPAPGDLRYAGTDDADMLVAWVDAFHRDTGIGGDEPVALVNHLIDQGRLFIWDDEGPVSMAAAMGDTPNGARIGYVYTPPEARGRGYASVLTARLSQALLDGDRSYVCLYADQAATTPNRIYRQIGYRPVCTVMDVEVVNEGD
jgi:predicted GNAT family acetyltransferase